MMTSDTFCDGQSARPGGAKSSPEFEIDIPALAEHIEMLHQLAAPFAGRGKLVLATFGEEPDGIDGKTGRPGRALPPRVLHFEIGNVQAHVAAAVTLAREPHRNVYMSLAVMRRDLPAGQKGSEKDIVALLGLVGDFDDADAAQYPARLPLPVDYVLETSAGRVQAFYFFDQPVDPQAVKPVAEQLKNHARCDHGTMDLSHVWRVAGCGNWPNAKKVHQDGRSRIPQLVRVAVPWSGTVTSVAALTAALGVAAADAGSDSTGAEEPAGAKQSTAEDRKAANDDDQADEVQRVVVGLPPHLRRMIVEPTIGDRSRAIFIVIAALVRMGSSDATIEAVIRAYPQGIGEKHANRNDLLREIVRIRSKVTNGQGVSDASDNCLEIGSDVEIAGRVLNDLTEAHGSIVHTEGGFWRYGGSHWEMIQDAQLRLLVHAYDGAGVMTTDGKILNKIKLNRSRIDSVLNEMEALAAAPDFFTAMPVGINCASGFIEFGAEGTPMLCSHAPGHRQRHTLSGCWPLAEDRRAARAESLLARLLGGCFASDADVGDKNDLLAEIAGAAALGYGTRLIKPKAIIFKGETAENGKSQVLDLIRGLLPESAISALPPGRFGDERFAIHLVGKLLNASDELTSASAIASDSFKLIVTGEPVTARDVYRPAITFRPVAQHVFATNDLPGFRGGMDRGVQRRLLIIPFNRTIPENERIEHIGARVAQEEADLLLDWAVEGAARLVKQRHFTEPKSCHDALREWLLGIDPVLAWLDVPGRVRIGECRPKVLTATAHAAFKAWAVEEGFSEGTLPAVNTFVQRLLGATRSIERVRDRRGRYLIGIDLDPVE